MPTLHDAYLKISIRYLERQGTSNGKRPEGMGESRKADEERARADGLIRPRVPVDGASCLPLVTPGSAEYYGVVERV